MILGDTCTRACRFCNVKTGNPRATDPHEAEKTAQSVSMMKLKYAVLTMVDRDDLEDGGVDHVKSVFQAIRQTSPETLLEFLGGDFCAKDSSLLTMLQARPEVFAHNIETVERLTPRVRDATGFLSPISSRSRSGQRTCRLSCVHKERNYAWPWRNNGRSCRGPP